MRGRSRNKGPNPLDAELTRSNGPDVKVRGTAQTVADKYSQLRGADASASGDRVMAENYYQPAAQH